MSRILTSGFELNQMGTNSAELWTAAIGSPAISASAAYTGAYGLRANGSSGQALASRVFTAMGAGRTYYVKFHLKIVTLNTTADQLVANLCSATNDAFELWLDTSGNLSLTSGTQVPVGSSIALTAGVWYRIEVAYTYTGGNATLKVDGTQIASGTATANIAADRLELGGWNGSAAGTFDLYFDDAIVNDDQGANENTWVDNQRVVYLKPVTDNSRGGWTAGGGGTTNLYDALDNTPPAGAATDTNTSCIKNVNSSATDNCDVNCTDYATAGIGASDTIKTAQAVVRHGEHITTSAATIATAIVSNPTESGETTVVPGTAAHSNEIGGWLTLYGAIQYVPTVTKGTRPVVRVGKRTASTKQVCIDALGILVTYLPAVGGVSVATDARVDVDSLRTPARDSGSPVDAMAYMIAERFSSIGWLTALARDYSTVADWKAFASSPDGVMQVDFAGFVERLLDLRADWRLPVSGEHLADADWRVILLPRDCSIALDVSGFLYTLMDTHLDWRIELGRDAEQGLQILAGAGRDMQLAAAMLAAAERDSIAPIDWQGVPLLIRDALMEIDWSVAVLREIRVHHSWDLPILRDSSVDASNESAVNREVSSPLNWQVLTEQLAALGFEYRTFLTREGCIELEWVGVIVQINSAVKLKDIRLGAQGLSKPSMGAGKLAKVSIAQVENAGVKEIVFLS